MEKITPQFNTHCHFLTPILPELMMVALVFYCARSSVLTQDLSEHVHHHLKRAIQTDLIVDSFDRRGTWGSTRFKDSDEFVSHSGQLDLFEFIKKLGKKICQADTIYTSICCTLDYLTTQSTCPMTNRVRTMAGNIDGTLYYYWKQSFSQWCDMEDG
eukprot:4101252-Amphidinium_carterae.2